MLLACKLTVLIYVASQLPKSDASVIGGKCGILGYFQALAPCFSEIPMAIGQLPTLDYIKQFCSSGLVDKTITCVNAVTELCDYSILSKTLMDSGKTIICQNFGKILPDSNKCHPTVTDIMSCLVNVKVDVNNPICSGIGKISSCVVDGFKACSRQISDALKTAISSIVSDCQSSLQSADGRCSLLTYAIGAVSCYSPAVVDFVRRFNMSEKKSQPIATLCRIKKLDSAMTCHKDIDQHCSQSLMNVDHLKEVKTSLCSQQPDFSALKCVTKDYKGVIKCISKKLTFPLSPCRFITNAEKCYTDVFDECPSNLKNFMSKLYRLAIPGFCTRDSDACSLIEYFGSFGLCWAKPIVEVVSNFINNPQLLSKSKCGNSKVSATCQSLVDKKCKMSLIDPSATSDFIGVICKNPKVFTAMSQSGCLSKVLKPLQDCKSLKLSSKEINNKDDVCRSVDGAQECLNSGFANCEGSVQKMFKAALKMTTPVPCAQNEPTNTAPLSVPSVTALALGLALYMRAMLSSFP